MKLMKSFHVTKLNFIFKTGEQDREIYFALLFIPEKFDFRKGEEKMSSEMSSENIYGYCVVHKVKYRYIGNDKRDRAMVQCPKCFEKRIVPKSWVAGLTPVAPMGQSLEEKYENRDKRPKGTSANIINRDKLKQQSRERALARRRW